MNGSFNMAATQQQRIFALINFIIEMAQSSLIETDNSTQYTYTAFSRYKAVAKADDLCQSDRKTTSSKATDCKRWCETVEKYIIIRAIFIGPYNSIAIPGCGWNDAPLMV